MSRIISVDLGGTWLRVGTIDSSHHTAEPVGVVQRYPSPDNWEGLADILQRHRTDNVDGFGIAISGPIQDHATLLQAPNLPWLNGRNIRRDLQQSLGTKVIVSNDMEAATEGEMAHGVLHTYSWAIFDTISTGWGGNLILDGKRVDGEPGHANVRFDVPHQCGAGHIGCYESLYSGSALERQICQHMNQSQIVGHAPWDYLQQQWSEDDPWAVSLLNLWGEGVGRAWGNTLNRIRPLQAIVYMGTTAKTLLRIPSVEAKVRATIRKIAMYSEHQADDFPIVRATFTHRSLFGAAIVFGRVD